MQKISFSKRELATIEIAGSFWIALLLITLIPCHLGYYFRADPLRSVVYGSPIPYLAFAGSSLEWRYDIVGLFLNGTLGGIFILPVVRRLGRMATRRRLVLKGAIFLLVAATCLSTARIYFETNGLRLVTFMGISRSLVSKDENIAKEIQGVCLATHRFYYLNPDRQFPFCAKGN